jgi:hypothetical protein
MTRVLTVHRATVPLAERSRYLEKLKLRKTHYTASGCRFWVFEEAGLQGAFLEFTEAGDHDTLVAAHRNWPDRFGDGSRVYQEVELN